MDTHEHAELPFTEAEIAQLHQEDRLAGTVVVCLLLGIFISGIVLYAAIAVVCASG